MNPKLESLMKPVFFLSNKFILKSKIEQLEFIYTLPYFTSLLLWIPISCKLGS